MLSHSFSGLGPIMQLFIWQRSGGKGVPAPAEGENSPGVSVLGVGQTMGSWSHGIILNLQVSHRSPKQAAPRPSQYQASASSRQQHFKGVWLTACVVHGAL